MAVGDIINGTFALGTTDFQPAAGVEIIITYVGGGVNTGYGLGGSQVGLTDGTNVSRYYHNMAGYGGNSYRTFGAVDNNGGNLKIGITNSVYLSLATSGNASYSGIQIK